MAAFIPVTEKKYSRFEEGTLHVCGCGVFIWHWLQQHLLPGLFLICSYSPAVWHLCLKIGKFLCMHLVGGMSLTDLKVAPFLVRRSANISTINPITSPGKAEWFHCVRHPPPLLLSLKPSPSSVFLIFSPYKCKRIPESFSADCPPKIVFHLLFMGASTG